MFTRFVGLTPETAAIVESFRESPAELDDTIIARMGSRAAVVPNQAPPQPVHPQRTIGCDLGYEVVLEQEEQIECYLSLSDMERRQPDGTAVARDGYLYVDGERVMPRRIHGELQAALVMIQQRHGHRSDATGDLISLNAWRQWFKNHNGRRVSLGSLRPNGYLRHRRPRR